MARIRRFEQGEASQMLIFDVETANEKNIGSICAIGWMLLDDDQVVDEGYTLINPHCPFSSMCTNVHGITSRDVADAPCFAEYWESTLGSLMATSLVVAHSANFDLSAVLNRHCTRLILLIRESTILIRCRCLKHSLMRHPIN